MIFRAMHFERFRRWIAFLLVDAGCFFSRVLTSMNIPLPTLPEIPFISSSLFEPIPLSLSVFHLFSDAAVETDHGGLGGWAHGDYWHFDLSAVDRALMHITAWEFMALALNVIIFGPLLAGHCVKLYSDALATIQILSSGAAHANA
jgi:hypothetical protein